MPSLVTLAEISDYHKDAGESLRLYYSKFNSAYATRFAGYLDSEVSEELLGREKETDMRSALVLLARLEAAFRRDYHFRVRAKLSDDISVEFRRIHKAKGDRARLEDDILSLWRSRLAPDLGKLVSELRGMFKYRHWLAHGRHWTFGNARSYDDIYLVADVLLSSLDLKG